MPRRVNRRLLRRMHWAAAAELGAPGADLTSTTAELNILDGVTSTAAELNILDGVTSTAAELNILDGVTSTAAELNILDGVTSTATELNLVDGSVVANSVASKAALVDANKYLQTNANNGTAGTACTAVHYGDGINVTAVITVTAAVLTVGNSASLGVGYLVYTLPAGNISIMSAFMSMAISGVTTTTDTPDVGLGTVIASGVVTTLDGTPTFENILTGQTATDTNGTATIASVATHLNVLTGGAHTVHFNAADGWGANADADAALDGTIVLTYRYNDA